MRKLACLLLSIILILTMSVNAIATEGDFPQLRSACDICGKPMKQFDRGISEYIPCSKDSSKRDAIWLYAYECNYCGNMGIIERIVCNH